MQKTNMANQVFCWACERGHSDVVKMFMANALILSIDLNSKSSGITAFQAACFMGHSEVIKIFKENATALGLDITGENFITLECVIDN